MKKQPVQRISRYEVVAELGRGAMGVVYKAKDPNIERIIALKTLRIDTQGTDQEEILRRFKHEAKLAGVMTHPNIVAIYDAGEFEGVFYMALEFIEGETLQEILHREKTLPLEQVVKIAKHVGPALDYAHQRGVIHRDIKPANLMVGKDGTVKIMDFGIAKAGGNMTSAGQVLGTPTYMSPEQVRGRNLDGRSDLFSFGCCLYEMLSGHKPYEGPNVTAIIYKIINDTPPPLHTVAPAISERLSDVISRCLEKDPELRYQNCAEVVEDLEASLAKPAPVKPIVGDRTAQIGSAGGSAVVPGKASAPKHPTPVPVTPAASTPAAAAAATSKVHGSTVNVAPKPTAAPATGNRSKQWILGTSFALVIALGAVLMFFRNRSDETTTASAFKPAVNPATKTAPKPAAPTKTKAAKGPGAENTSAAVAAAITGDLRITSDPPGVRVFISGMTQNDWVTPFTAKDLDAGVYEVQFSKSGYPTKNEDVTVEPGKTAELNVTLAAAGGSIVIHSAPSGAGVWLDGKPTGKNTPVTFSVEKGSHKLEVRKQGYEVATTTISVKDNESIRYAPALAPVLVAVDMPKKGGFFGKLFGGTKVPEGKGLSDIKTKPLGAQIVLNGKAQTGVSPARIPLDPGKYKLTLRLAGYKPISREIVIEKGKITESNAEFESAR